jgi:hypothetical protein
MPGSSSGGGCTDRSHTPGVRCSAQRGYFACQGGHGYEKPIVSFTVRDRQVVGVFMAALAD